GNEDQLMESMAVVPLGMLLNALFLAVWVVLPSKMSTQRPLVATTVASLVVWACAGVLLLLVIDQMLAAGMSNWAVGGLGLVLLIALAIRFNWEPKAAPKGSQHVRWPILVGRGSAAAIAIGCAVWLAGQGQPLLAGLAAVFPAIFLTSMVALWLAQGETVPQGAAGPMMLGGVSVAVYALIVMWSIPSYGIFIGSIIGWAGSVVGWSIPTFFLLRRRSLNRSLLESNAQKQAHPSP
ncbi:hypothetical protein N8930_04480, partial [Euryarchaeota archaeon]|nr:hypothetical protein [Euryarchaeota archaeon]